MRGDDRQHKERFEHKITITRSVETIGHHGFEPESPSHIVTVNGQATPC